MRRLCVLVFAAILAAVFALVASPRADAYVKRPCIAGTSWPTCYVTTGKVTFVADGDTLDVNVYGDGRSTPIRVRMIGINAIEQSVYSRDPARRRGACHALEATARLQQLMRGSGNFVRLYSQDRVSKAGHRYRRAVSVRVNGYWRDAGQILLREGHVLWLAGSSEWAHNTRYAEAAQRAAAARLRLWDPDYCAAGPDDAAALRMWVNWDADGSETDNLNGEWVRIKNDGATDLSIAGWWFRDSFVHRYTFPAGAAIPAGESVTLYVGSRPASDTNTTTHFYWRRASPVFDNAGRRGLGDGGYLFDPQGDLRLSMMYPCRYSCSDPLRGKIALTAHARAPEYVEVENVSASPVDLEGYVLENPPYVYSFGPNAVLKPRETMKLEVYGSPTSDTALVKHWGKQSYILNDAGDLTRLRTQTNITLACYAWGSFSC